MEATNSDMRKYPRFDLKQPLKVVDNLSGEAMGTLVNISKEGMMIFGDKALVSDGVYQVSLAIKAETEEGFTLSLGVECLWSNTEESDGSNWSGLRIIDISASQQSLLDHMIDTLGTPS